MTGDKYPMRNWIDLVEQFEPSDYGYWIMPEGEIVPCSVMTHGEAAAHQLGVPDDFEDDEEREREIVDEAMQEGSVRIVASKGSSEFNAEWSDTAITTSAKRALLDVMSMYQNREHFLLQNEYFEQYREAVRYVRNG